MSAIGVVPRPAAAGGLADPAGGRADRAGETPR